jgi:glutamate N-acetyltransferase/amino-acid N-acetyltransferase
VTALPAGFRAAGIACGLKPSGKKDLGLIVSDRPAVAAGVFTRNRVQAAPVQVTKRQLRRGVARALVVNTGNANACTGRQGVLDARAMIRATAQACGVKPVDVLVASTGIIGVPLDVGTVIAGIGEAAAVLSDDGLDDLSEAILTTDTVTKVVSTSVAGGTIVGFAKGAGMIAPEMATMLCFLLTDLPVSRALLSQSLQTAVNGTFNAISVDGCMSTNDCVIALANGTGEPIALDDARAPAFVEAVTDVCGRLARKIVEDGEGATKVVSIVVDTAANEREARVAARAIADSVLLRCALNGGDPNWGRVLAALGTAPIPFDANVVDVRIGGEAVCEHGGPGSGDLAVAAAAMKEREVEIRVSMHRGNATATILTNDLSPEYVRFNAEYTT